MIVAFMVWLFIGRFREEEKEEKAFVNADDNIFVCFVIKFFDIIFYILYIFVNINLKFNKIN